MATTNKNKTGKGAEKRTAGVLPEFTDNVAKGAYSNYLLVCHTPVEFYLDFAAIVPLVEQPQMLSRIIVAPEHAKRFLRALQQNMDLYEEEHGEIILHSSPVSVNWRGSKEKAKEETSEQHESNT